ncbi:DUF6879 family protein [Streptomyces sp. NPDC057696]|uniref:DUF6879 family protein n=1 Tax=Streptomyces sp. NPDC057696 TaxID=3346218 RepID=UPI0036943864
MSHLFTEFERTAFRPETRRGYATDRAGARFKALLRGVDPEPDHPWKVNVRDKAEQGARFSRVGIVDEPPTDGQRHQRPARCSPPEGGSRPRLPGCEVALRHLPSAVG